MRDRFTKAVSELEERNAFICDSCEGRPITHGEEHHPVSHERVRELGGLGRGIGRDEALSKSDPTPFGV